MNLLDLLKEENIFFNLEATNKKEILKLISSRIAEKENNIDPDKLYETLLAREELESTGLGNEIAIPHCHMEGFKGVELYMVTLEKPVDFEALDDKKVSLIFVIVANKEDNDAYLRVLSALSIALSNLDITRKLVKAPTPKSVRRILSSLYDEEERMTNQLKTLLKLQQLEYKILVSEMEKQMLQKAEAKKLDKEIETLTKEKNSIEEQLDPSVINQYQNLKDKFGSNFTAKINDNVCGACYMQLPIHVIREVERGHQIVFCPYCAKMLYT